MKAIPQDKQKKKEPKRKAMKKTKRKEEKEEEEEEEETFRIGARRKLDNEKEKEADGPWNEVKRKEETT